MLSIALALLFGRDVLRRVYRLALGLGDGREGVAKVREGFWCDGLLLIKLPTFAGPYIISPMRSGRQFAVFMQDKANSRNGRPQPVVI